MLTNKGNLDSSGLFASPFFFNQTSNSVLWMIYNLGKYPHIQDKIYQEVESVVGKDGDVTTKHLAKVSYLKAFTRESMRCAPYCLYLTSMEA